jgi:hypothetical protein
MSLPNDTRIEIEVAQAMADLCAVTAQYRGLPRAIQEGLPTAIRSIDVAHLEARRVGHWAASDETPPHRIRDLLASWDSRLNDNAHPLRKPAEGVHKLLHWLWPGVQIDTAGCAMLDRVTASVDAAAPWFSETAPLARLVVGLERWRALRGDCTMIPGIDLAADLLFMQGLMHTMTAPLPWSVARAIAGIESAPGPAGPRGERVAGPRALLAALGAEASRTLNRLDSGEFTQQLVARMRAGMGRDIPDSLFADLVAGAVLPRGVIREQVAASDRQGTREIARMIAVGWLTSDSPKGPVRLRVPENVLVDLLAPELTEWPAPGSR